VVKHDVEYEERSRDHPRNIELMWSTMMHLCGIELSGREREVLTSKYSCLLM
jgi:hypothetical protein